jgi:uncharacterized protein
MKTSEYFPRMNNIGVVGRQICDFKVTTDIALFLIANGADIDYEDRGGNNLLHYAVLKSRFAKGFFETRLVAALIEKGILVNKPNRDGKTPLYYAIRKDIVDFLISKGASK